MVFSPIKTLGQIVGGVKDFAWFPCADDPMLYISTFLPAAARVFISFVQPDVKHVVHKSTGKSVLCHLETVANELEEVEPTWQNQALEFIFEFDKTLDQAVFWMFIADVLSEGLFRWTSAVVKLSGCANRPNPNVASGPGMTFGSPGTTDWQAGCHAENTSGSPPPLVPFAFDQNANGPATMLQMGSLMAGELAIPTATRWHNIETGAVQNDTSSSLENWQPTDTPMNYFKQGRTLLRDQVWQHELSSPIGDRFSRIVGAPNVKQYAAMRNLS